MENMIVSACDVDIANATLMLALAGSGNKHYAVNITLNSDRLAKVFGTNAFSQLKDRAVRVCVENNEVTNLYHIIEDYPLIVPNDSAACEMDTKNEP